MNVSIYGNFVVDTVIQQNTTRTQLGGIANVWDAIIKLDASKRVSIEPTDIGMALIYVDEKICQKIARPNLQVTQRVPTVRNSDWTHIAYINTITDLSFVNSIKNSIVSADIAGDSKFDTDVLRHIDYLFVSDDEVSDLPFLRASIKQAVIVHSSSGSIVYPRTSAPLIYSFDVLNDVNVLGAGDFFAGAFIVNMLNGHTLADSVQHAHLSTFNHLKSK